MGWRLHSTSAKLGTAAAFTPQHSGLLVAPKSLPPMLAGSSITHLCLPACAVVVAPSPSAVTNCVTMRGVLVSLAKPLA